VRPSRISRYSRASKTGASACAKATGGQGSTALQNISVIRVVRGRISLVRREATIFSKRALDTNLKLARFPATRRGLTFYVADPLSSVHEFTPIGWRLFTGLVYN